MTFTIGVAEAARDARVISRWHEAAWRRHEGLPDDPTQGTIGVSG